MLQLEKKSKTPSSSGGSSFTELEGEQFSCFDKLRPYDFELYPTITSDKVFLKVNEAVEEMLTIKITSTLGLELHSFSTQDSRLIPFELGKMSAGLYHLFVLKGQEIVFAGKIVKAN